MGPWRKETILAVALAVVTGATYARTCLNEFVNYDDRRYVTENPAVLSGLSLPGLRWALTTTEAANWHPLTWLSLQLDAQLYGTGPGGFHFTNLLLHVANTVLLFHVIRRMSGAVWRSALVAALFALHPLHVESVAWVAERKDVLSTLFGMLTLTAYAWYAERPSSRRYGLVVVAFVLGLMAKPMLVTLPFVLLLLDYWPLGRVAGAILRDRRDKPGGSPLQDVATAKARSRGWLALVAEKLPLLALAAGSCVITLIAQGRGQAFGTLPLADRAANAVVAAVAYLGKTVWPVGLAVYYPHPQGNLPATRVAGAAAVLVALTVLAVVQARRRPYLPVGWFWYLGTLVPVIGLVQVGDQAIADRYTYVPLIGIFIIAAWGLAELAGERPAARVVAAMGAGLALAVCASRTGQQVDYWRDSVTLWTHAVEVTGESNYFAEHNLADALDKAGDVERAVEHFRRALEARPNSSGIHVNMGIALVHKAQVEAARRGERQLDLAEARRHFETAARLDPENVLARYSLAQTLTAMGEPDAARRELETALRLAPDYLAARAGLGTVLIRDGRFDEAVRLYRQGLERTPDYPEFHYKLGLALCLQGKRDDAAACYRRAVELAPDNGTYHYFLAYALAEQGQAKEAAAHYRRALELEPRWPALANEEAWQLATAPDARLRNGKLAVRLAREVNQATGDQDPYFLDVLAAALAEAGRFDEAVAVARHARERTSSAADPGFARAVEARLQLYLKKQPYHERPPRPESGPVQQHTNPKC